MNEPFFATKAQERIHSDIAHAIHRLLNELDIDPDLVPGTRLYHAEIVQPDDNTTVILVIQILIKFKVNFDFQILPRSDDVCSVPTGSSKTTEYMESKRQCNSVPIPVFDMSKYLKFCNPKKVLNFSSFSDVSDQFSNIILQVEHILGAFHDDFTI